MPERAPRQDEGGPDQGWLVTFSDCMTLLLCFFVMLLSFSSFSEEMYGELSGAFYEGLHDYNPYFQQADNDALSQRPDSLQPQQDVGSRIPTGLPQDVLREPKAPVEISDRDAFRDRRVFYLQAGQLFVGQGTVWRDGQAKACLDQIAMLSAKLDCQVIVGASGAGGDLQQPQAVLNYLHQRSGQPAGHFSLSACDSGASRRMGGAAVIEVALLNRSVGQ